MRSALAAALLLLSGSMAYAQRNINWSVQANELQLAEGESITLTCPPNGRIGQVWGTDTYTDDSVVCAAALHAGAITMNAGGTFIMRRRPGQQSYAGSTRNGVTTSNYGPWQSSFSISPGPPPPVVRALGRAVEPAPAAPLRVLDEPETITWERSATRLAPNGARFTFRCPPRGKAAVVKGAEVYSWDSSICTAAVHAGAITLERGGVVTIEMRPGSAAYAGSTRNGVTAIAGTRTTLGFVVTRAPDRS